MKTLTILFLLITTTVYSQTVGLSVSPIRLGIGAFYATKDLPHTSTATFIAFEAGRSRFEEKFTWVKPSIGLTYVIDRDDRSFQYFCSRVIGTICYNYTTPDQQHIINTLSMEIGVNITYNKLVLLIMYDIINKDAKIGVGKYFK